MFVYPENLSLKTVIDTWQGMASIVPARQMPEESCRIARVFNDAGRCLPPLQATKPYDQLPKHGTFLWDGLCIDSHPTNEKATPEGVAFVM